MSVHPAFAAILAEPFPPAITADADLRDGQVVYEIRDPRDGHLMFSGSLVGAALVLTAGRYRQRRSGSPLLWERRVGR